MKLFKPTLVAVALMTLMGCQEDVKQEEKALVLDTEVQKQAYGLGASIGMFTQRNLEQQSEMGLSLDQAMIIRGFTDSLAGKSIIEKEEIQALMMNLEQTMKAKQQEATTAGAEKALAEGEAFLAENAKKEGVKVTESGIQYLVLAEGEGEKPTATDKVKVNYKGTFINGEEFDSSKKPITFGLNQVIPGWTEGVQLMAVGSKFKFTIPANLAYGSNGRPGMPGNSVLEFEIELLEIVKPAEPAKVGHKESE